MSGFQIVILLLAGGFALSSFWPSVKAIIDKLNEPKTEVKPEVKPAITPENIVEHPDCDELVCIVKCWEELKESCEAKGLTSATKELEKIFPLFVVKGDKNEQ